MLLILAVDHFLDMGRSATNVVGNAVASVVVLGRVWRLGAVARAADAVGDPALEPDTSAGRDSEIGWILEMLAALPGWPPAG